ncbi:MAG: phosphorybosylanthranilate isomerase [Deltaproteobacteria bacterium]|nr:phosphorybosylanthranilate isomerase [Deltaproteobacteria bacterium]
MKMTGFPKLIGVIHLPALPGAPGCRLPASEAVSRAARHAVSEAKMLEAAGFEGIIVENFGDAPFYRSKVPPLTISAMSVIVASVRDVTKLPLGINVLRNDGRAALAIAAVAGAQFIRVNVLTGVAATDQGIIEGEAAELMRAGGDAVIVTGTTTGRAIELARLQAAAAQRTGAPLYLGSGVTPENIESYSGLVHGVIVGSALRERGVAGAPLESARVRKFSKAWKERA